MLQAHSRVPVAALLWDSLGVQEVHWEMAHVSENFVFLTFTADSLEEGE